jgi:protein TonB
MNRDISSFGLSFFMHAVILASCIYLLPALDLQPKPLVIDFSLLSAGSPSITPKVPDKEEQPLEPPPVLQPPPPPRQLVKPEPIKKVLPETVPEKVVVEKKISRPVEKILPKKEERTIEQEVAPPQISKNVVPLQARVLTPDPVGHSPVSRSKQVQQTLSEKSSVPVPKKVSRQEMEQHYVKAHFVYIKKIIEKNISYPSMARRMGWQGKVLLSFIVCRDGRIEDLQIVESSGYKQLDRNALETVKQVEPFPNPPVRVKLVLPVLYRIG